MEQMLHRLTTARGSKVEVYPKHLIIRYAPEYMEPFGARKVRRVVTLPLHVIEEASIKPPKGLFGNPEMHLVQTLLPGLHIVFDKEKLPLAENIADTIRECKCKVSRPVDDISGYRYRIQVASRDIWDSDADAGYQTWQYDPTEEKLWVYSSSGGEKQQGNAEGSVLQYFKDLAEKGLVLNLYQRMLAKTREPYLFWLEVLPAGDVDWIGKADA